MIACPDCAAVQEMPPVRHGSLRCFQCHSVLERTAGKPTGGALACSLATLLLLIPANTMVLMSIHRFGIGSHAYLASGVSIIWSQGWPFVAIAVALTAMILPFVRFGLLSMALAALHLGKTDSWVGPVFRWAEGLDLWAMPDVYLIGIAIGWKRLIYVAPTTIGPGGWCAVGAAFMCMISRGALDRHRIWRHIKPATTLHTRDAFGCDACGFVVPSDREGEKCPRCRKRLWRRRAHLMDTALALTLAGMVLYPVAMFLNVSSLDWFAGSSGHSIFSAVMVMFRNGIYFLGGCVLTTSVLIPFIKLAGILYFYISVKRRSAAHLIVKTRLYRFIDELGRWSTMDVFTVVVYLPLLQFGQIASARVGEGLPALLAVVLLTMFASRCFDPRLMWDAARAR